MATFPAKTNYAAGNVLTAAQMVDIGDQINALNGTVGKNKIINGDFRIWQRGTSFTTGSSGTYVYTADRWVTYFYGTNTSSVSQQSFTAGTAPVAGYEGQYFLRFFSSNTQAFIAQRIEDVRTFAGQTITVSFWAKAASGTPSLGINSAQLFGSGGSSPVVTSGTTQTLSTSWTRYSTTFAMPSISGKTIGSGNYVELALFTGTLNVNIDIWGVQVEAGNTATAFQTATGTIQGELAACQRYYCKSYNQGTAPGDGAAASAVNRTGTAYTTSNMRTQEIKFPVVMRSAPNVTLYRTTAIVTNGRWAYYTTAWQTATIGSGAITDNSFHVELGGTFTLQGSYLVEGDWVANIEL